MLAKEFESYIIIVTSDEPYSKMWHTQLIYTEFLSKSNNVFYINPPKKWGIKNIFNYSLNKKKINDKLTVLNYINKLPAIFNLFNWYNEYYNERKLAKEINLFNCKQILVWHFDSFRNKYNHKFFLKGVSVKRIYHVIDPFFKNPIDRWLCAVSDLIIITSSRNNKYYEDFTDKIINIPQCLDLELQYSFLNENKGIEVKSKLNYFVLLGTISDDIDFDWLFELLKVNGFKLVIIGKIIDIAKSKHKWDTLLRIEYVEYLGLLSPKEFYPVLKKAMAGLVVYNEERRAKICSPLKAINYIISDIPVITNIDCEIPELVNHSIFYCDNIQEMTHKVLQALNNNFNSDKTKAQAYLEKISLANNTQKIIKRL